ncbi:MAG TPA: beta-propeller fold lactonase family protein [Terriglobales bacterium]|nr:beta-propeller fold lactonase family protein [Terriglobales bacterium]
MRTSLESWLLRLMALVVGISVAGASALGAGNPHYVVTNDDVPPALATSVSFFTVGAGGQLTLKAKVLTGRGGIAGGYFAANRVNVVQNGNLDCAYASISQGGEIEGISIKTLTIGGHAIGSSKDTGASNGIGLAINAHYLYASFTDSNTIGTFRVQPGCKIKFVSDITVVGLQRGVIDGMVIHGNIMVVTYGDGSIESFDISAGVPKSNGDEQNSTGSRRGNTYPSGVDITQDGHYAIFGDTSPFTTVEVSDISSGKLTPTVVYELGKGINSSNVLLSPDETLLYISNNQGGTITAAFFDKSTGKLSKGCVSQPLKGFVTNWSYVASLALDKTTGTGGVVYVAEYGAPSSIGEINVKSAKGKCTLKESSSSPVADPNSPGLLSIGAFPPRPF